MNTFFTTSLEDCLVFASDPNTPEAKLERLACHPDWLVRSLVAKHSKTSAKAIEHLLKDPHPLVREAAYHGKR